MMRDERALSAPSRNEKKALAVLMRASQRRQTPNALTHLAGSSAGLHHDKESFERVRVVRISEDLCRGSWSCKSRRADGEAERSV